MKTLGLILRDFLPLTLIVAPAFAGNAPNYTYLALGDSVAFGYDPTVLPPAPAKFIGYPEIVAAELGLQSGGEVNAACPGQTSSSFLTGGADNGCQGFKDNIGLHTNYPGTQAGFAVSQLLANKNINLVTLSIGGNDLLLLQQACANAQSFQGCVLAALPDVLKTYGTNLAQILYALRVVGGYTGNLVLVKYSAPNNDPLFIQAIAALNQVMVAAGSPFGVKFADGFTAFQVASAPYLGDPCAAGLLVRLSATSCDVHPDFAGQSLLAASVFSALNFPQLTTGSNCNGIYAGTFQGNLTVTSGQNCVLVSGGVNGNTTVKGGALAISNVTIAGNVQVQGGGAISIGPAAVINGDLQVQNIPLGGAPSQVCGSTVKGNLQFQNNGTAVAIGSGSPLCSGNVITGNLEVHNNTGSTAILGNAVGGNLQDQNNSGPTLLFNNTVRHNLQCQNNSSITGGANTAAQKQGQCAGM